MVEERTVSLYSTLTIIFTAPREAPPPIVSPSPADSYSKSAKLAVMAVGMAGGRGGRGEGHVGVGEGVERRLSGQ
jgi:hypothetical protein